MSSRTLRAELDAMRAELARLQAAGARRGAAVETVPNEPLELREQIAELNVLVRRMLEEAEEAITEHPAAAVAGALALGIVIGRLTAR